MNWGLSLKFFTFYFIWMNWKQIEFDIILSNNIFIWMYEFIFLKAACVWKTEKYIDPKNMEYFLITNDVSTEQFAIKFESIRILAVVNWLERRRRTISTDRYAQIFTKLWWSNLYIILHLKNEEKAIKIFDDSILFSLDDCTNKIVNWIWMWKVANGLFLLWSKCFSYWFNYHSPCISWIEYFHIPNFAQFKIQVITIHVLWKKRSTKTTSMWFSVCRTHSISLHRLHIMKVFFILLTLMNTVIIMFVRHLII